MIKPNEEAPQPFADYREILDNMSPHDQAAAVGASCYRLLKTGVIKWEDVVTKNRVRDFREVVAMKKLTVAEMTKHGVAKYQAEKAYASVHTPAHEHAERQRREALERLTGAGIAQDKLVEELSKRLAGRLTVAAGPTGAQVGRPQDNFGPAWAAQTLPGTGPSSAGELAKLITGWKPPRPPRKPKPPAAAAAETQPSPEYKFETHGNVAADDIAEMKAAIEAFPKPVLDAISGAGYKFVFAEDLASFDPGMAKNQPRGWPAGMTWANSDGYHDGLRKTILATEKHLDFWNNNAVVKSDRTVGVMRHEAGHAFDFTPGILSNYSQRQEFRAAYNKDLAKISDASKPNLEYYLQRGDAGPSEVFAETFAQAYGGGSDDSEKLAKHFPNCAELIAKWTKGSVK